MDNAGHDYYCEHGERRYLPCAHCLKAENASLRTDLAAARAERDAMRCETCMKERDDLRDELAAARAEIESAYDAVELSRSTNIVMQGELDGAIEVRDDWKARAERAEARVRQIDFNEIDVLLVENERMRAALVEYAKHWDKPMPMA